MADYRKIEAAFQERGNKAIMVIILDVQMLITWLIDARIKRLTEDLQRVNHDMTILREEIGQIIKLKDKKVGIEWSAQQLLDLIPPLVTTKRQHQHQIRNIYKSILFPSRR